MRAIDPDILPILSGCYVQGNVVKIAAGQLPREQYNRLDKVLKALGGKWDRRAEGHVFGEDPANRLEAAILSGTYEKFTVGGFFETPSGVAMQCAELLDVQPAHTLLEPSAGRGALLRGLQMVPRLGELPSRHVTLVETRPDNVAVLREQGWPRVYEGDFLTAEPPPGRWPRSSDSTWYYDRILMNPPFERLADVDHVTHALKFLKPGGRLVAIMSPGWTFRKSSKAADFRELFRLEARRTIFWAYHWEPLPDGSFEASGTMVRTGILVVDKR